MIIKLLLMVVLILLGLLYWLLPETKVASHFKMNETLFSITNIIGIICGAIGLAITIIFPQFIMKEHLYEIILLPFLFINVYWAIIIKVRKSEKILDEKQEYDMTQGATKAWIISIPVMLIVFWMYKGKILEGAIFFPIYLFQTLFFYSAGTLFYFKKA